MVKTYLWKNGGKVNLLYDKDMSDGMKKLVAIDDHVFIRTTKNCVYHGVVISPFDETPYVDFKRTPFIAIDIDSNSKFLFIVTPDGFVLKINPETLLIVESFVVEDSLRSCRHGYKEGKKIFKVKQIAVNDTSALYVTEKGQLWASGYQPQININSNKIERVAFFEGREIFSIACGANFHLAMVGKCQKFEDDETGSNDDDDDEESFLESCPMCQNVMTMSMSSLTSSDIVPEASNIQQVHQNGSVDLVHPVSPRVIILPSRAGDESPCSHRSSSSNMGESVFEFDDIEIDPMEEKEEQKEGNIKPKKWVSLPCTGENLPERRCTSERLKQSLSNMANFVYEGFRKLGNKVIKLSRQLSGASNPNITHDNSLEDYEDISVDFYMPSTNRFRSSSIPAMFFRSPRNLQGQRISMEEIDLRTNALMNEGIDIMSMEVWAWGESNYGQLGTGDLLPRHDPVLVKKLQNKGVRKIACGEYHALALTLDGRLFCWGKNDAHQVAPDSTEDLLNAPRLFVPNGNTVPLETVKDMGAGSQHTLTIFDGQVIFIGETEAIEHFEKLSKLKINAPDTQRQQILHSSCSGPYSSCSTIMESNPELNFIRAFGEDDFLREMMIVHKYLITPLEAFCETSLRFNIFVDLFRSYKDLMSMIALNVTDLNEYTDHIGKEFNLALVTNADEFISLYQKYSCSICDVISMNGFAELMPMLGDLPSVIKTSFSSTIPDDKSLDENILATAFISSIEALKRYPTLISDLIRINARGMDIESLQDAAMKWERCWDKHLKLRNEAESTKLFWISTEKSLEFLKKRHRRFVRESRMFPLSIANTNPFVSRWFILMNDIIVFMSGTTLVDVQDLSNVWVKPFTDPDSMANGFSILTPEHSIVAYANSATDRNEWLLILQNAISSRLRNSYHSISLEDRSTSYTYKKFAIFKGATYTGRWFCGQPHGLGQMSWPDGRLYSGQFKWGMMDGFGSCEYPGFGFYRGEWIMGCQSGFGTFRYGNGDFYEGSFENDLPHGHGMMVQNHPTYPLATIYIGEWVAGLRQGFGVNENQLTGEKYMGSWKSDMMHGSGMIITSDGEYMEGPFSYGSMVGLGIMIRANGDYYQGVFKSTRVFGGKGLLASARGDVVQGNFYGSWNTGIKTRGELRMISDHPDFESELGPPLLGRLGFPPEQKWRAVIRQYCEQLGIKEPRFEITANHDRSGETQRAWQSVAVFINNSQHQIMMKNYVKRDGFTQRYKIFVSDDLRKIPQFGRDSFTLETFVYFQIYLRKAFESLGHPFGSLLYELSEVYTATYSGNCINCLLLGHAIEELHCILTRIYEMMTSFFCALPRYGTIIVLNNPDDTTQTVNTSTILYSILIPEFYTALFGLYILRNEKDDRVYWRRIIKWNEKTDVHLMSCLGVDEKFWIQSSTSAAGFDHMIYANTIETLGLLQSISNPLEKMAAISNTFEKMTRAVQLQLGSPDFWTMDELIRVFIYVIVRARIRYLGSEIHFITDFMALYHEGGDFRNILAKLKVCYRRILLERENFDN